jgi:hypothetical protein
MARLNAFVSPLDRGIIRRIRQNHAVEHATITVLMARARDVTLAAGRSNQRGFYIYGQVKTAALEAAAAEALARLQAGESGLAIHPNCGTNLVASGTLAGLAVMTTTALARRQRTSVLDRIPLGILAATAGIVAGRPLGFRLQRSVTTLADVGDLRLGPITRRQIGRFVQHFVTLETL